MNFNTQKNDNNFNYKEFVGPVNVYEYHGLLQKELLLCLGLKPYNTVLDVGCGGLRLGRLLIKYLDSSKYTGIEPMKSVLIQAIQKELDNEIIQIKKPKFLIYSDFNFRDNNNSLIPIQDFIIAFDVFFHCGKNQLELFLKNLSKISNNKTKTIVSVMLNNEITNKGIIESNEGTYYYPHASHRNVLYTIKDFQSIALSFGFDSNIIKFKKNIISFYDKNLTQSSRIIFLLKKL